MDFQDSMAKMSTLFDTAKTSVGGLQNQFESLSNETGKSATELAEAGYQALSAGQDVGNVTDFVKTSVKLAKAGFTDTTTAVDVLTTAMNAYGSKAGTADEISNKLVRTQNLGKTTVGELASAMGKIIPTASSMNVGIDNLTSGYVSLTKQGIATAEATTYMNSMLNELGDSGTTLGGVLKDKTGKSFQELMDSGMSLADILKITKDYADENGIAYNELWGSAEAGKAGMAILNGGVDEFNKTVETMSSDVDDVGEALEKLDTPQAKVGKATNVLKNDLMSFGLMLLDTASPAIDVFTDGIVSIGSHISDVLNNSSSLGEAVQTLINDAIKWMQDTIASGIPTVGYDFITNLVNGILGSMDSLLGSLDQLISTAISFLIPMGTQFLNTAMEFIGQMALGVINRLPQWITSLGNLVNKAITYLMSNLPLFLQKGIQIVLKLVDGLIQALPSVVSALIGLVSTMISTIVMNLPQFMTTAGQIVGQLVGGLLNSAWNLGSAVGQLMDVIREKFGSLPSLALRWGKDLVQSFVNGITSMISSVVNAVSGVANKVKAFLHFSEPDEGPLANFHTYAPDMMKLFASGITKNAGEIEDAFNESLSFVNDPIQVNTKPITTKTPNSSDSAMSLGNVTFNIYGAEDDEKLAEMVMDKLQHIAKRKESVFA